jgi:hypothetical protein
MVGLCASSVTTKTETASRAFVYMLHILAGTSVKYVLEQDKAAFIRLIGISVMQSAANSIVAPSLR